MPSRFGRRGTARAHDTTEQQESPADRKPRPARRSALVPLAVGVLAVVTAVLLPFAPVLSTQAQVTWPQRGELPEATTAFFVPYAPAETRVDVPCDVLRTAQQRQEPTTVVSSQPTGEATTGFAVTTAEDDVLVLLGGQQVHRGQIPGGDCSVRLASTPNGSTLSVGERAVPVPDEHVRSITAFTSDLSPEQAQGLNVQARTSNWFENSPTAPKLALVAGQLVLAGAGLWLLVRADRSRRRRTAQPDGAALRRTGPSRRQRRRAARPRGAVDLAVVIVLGFWAVAGPLSPDDSFTEGIVRNALDTGAFTNYYRWQNAAEAPFTLVLHLLSPLVALGADPLLLRVPSVLAGIATWLLLGRGTLPALLGARARHGWVYGFTASSFLLWWMPFNLGVRPEPFVALGTTVVLTCLLRGTQRPRGTGLALLGLAGLGAGLTLAVNPVGIVALAPIVVLAPQIWRVLRCTTGSGAGVLLPLARLALVCGLGAVGLVAMFADQSWFGVVRATELHQFYGPNLSWFQEFQRYQYLLGFDETFPEQGGTGRRLPVLITLAAVAGSGLLLVRGARHLPGMRRSYVPAGLVIVALALLALTPSKWTHYFGTLAGFGAAALTCGVVLFCRAARHWHRYRAAQLIAAGTVVAAVFAGCLAFAGENVWFLYSDSGVPNNEGPFWPLDQPWPWLVLLAGVFALAQLRRNGPAWSRTAMRLPAATSAAVVLAGITVLLVSFAVAPLRQADSYSLGKQNVNSLRRDTCGVLDYVVTPRTAPNGVLEPAGEEDASTTGFIAQGGYDGSSAPPESPGTGIVTQMWGSLDGGAPNTGELTSQWFTLPRMGELQELAISAAGRTGDGNQLRLEFGRSAQGQPRPLGEHVLDDSDEEPDKRPDYPSADGQQPSPQDNPDWRTLRMPSSAVPDEADRVRVRAQDATTDAGGWLAVTGPRVLDLAPVRDSLREDATTYVDWSMVWTAPCLRHSPKAAHGLVESPDALLLPPGELGFPGEASFEKTVGGSFAGADRIASRDVVPTRLLGTEDQPQYADWGQFVQLSYPFRRDAYDTELADRWRWGWQGPPASIGHSAHDQS